MGGVVDESNSAATSFGRQVYVAGLQVWSEDTSGSGKFLLKDHLGSTRITGDASGTLYDDVDYLPFGDISHNYGSAASDIHYQFTGDETDSESSTDYAMYRNLSGTMARFNRPDPYDGSYDLTNPQTFNRYVYVSNNPLRLVDPQGLDGEDNPCEPGGGGSEQRPALGHGLAQPHDDSCLPPSGPPEENCTSNCDVNPCLGFDSCSVADPASPDPANSVAVSAFGGRCI
jgi:RHS repeat-associated protein